MYMYFEVHDTTTGACARACSHAVDLHGGVCMQIVKDCTAVSQLILTVVTLRLPLALLS